MVYGKIKSFELNSIVIAIQAFLHVVNYLYKIKKIKDEHVFYFLFEKFSFYKLKNEREKERYEN